MSMSKCRDENEEIQTEFDRERQRERERKNARMISCVIRITLDKEANVAESTESCKTNEESSSGCVGGGGDETKKERRKSNKFSGSRIGSS